MPQNFGDLVVTLRGSDVVIVFALVIGAVKTAESVGPHVWKVARPLAIAWFNRVMRTRDQRVDQIDGRVHDLELIEDIQQVRQRGE